MSRVASFHLVRERAALAPLALARLATDRRPFRAVDGLRFVRLLGTGRGDLTTTSIDPRRTATFAVWDDETALDRFLAEHPIASRWRRADEAFHVRLRSLGGHGRWRGVPVLDGLAEGRPDGPVALVTRADVRVRRWRTFDGAGRSVADPLRRSDGLLAVVGIGEAPFGRLGTFSLWASIASMEAFAATAAHAEVVARTRRERWYGEELFARFEPYAASGRWGGRNPLVGHAAGGAVQVE